MKRLQNFARLTLSLNSFRYPFDRKRNLSIPPKLHVINLRQLRDGMDRLASFFDAVSMAFSRYLEFKVEMENSF
jgi:hypothetical protein